MPVAVIPPGTALGREQLERVVELTRLVGAAVGELAAIELQMTEGTYRARYLRGQLEEARGILSRLLSISGGGGLADGELVRWAREAFPDSYRYGAGLAVRDLRAQAIMSPVAGPAGMHTQALESLVRRFVADTTELVVELHAGVIRASRVVLAQAGFTADVAASVAGGLPRRELSRVLLRRLDEAVRGALPEGAAVDLTHVTIGGRRWRADAWAGMYGRTELARASTAGTRTLSAANGVDHVQVTSHAHEPCICTPFEGRIYRLERDQASRYPWVGILPGGGCPMHPNCVHREAPAVVALLEARGQAAGRDSVPADFLGLDPRELRRAVSANREALRPYAADPAGHLPADFRLESAR
jgi:hypothetical protein